MMKSTVDKENSGACAMPASGLTVAGWHASILAAFGVFGGPDNKMIPSENFNPLFYYA